MATKKEVDAPAKEVKLKYKIPKTVGAAIDLLQTIRATRQDFGHKEAAEKEQEGLVEKAIFEMFKKTELEGARGKLASATIKRSPVPNLKDWKKLWTHIKKTGDDDLLQRRLSIEACRLRWSQKKAIPGVEIFDRISLHLTKSKT